MNANADAAQGVGRVDGSKEMNQSEEPVDGAPARENPDDELLREQED